MQRFVSRYPIVWLDSQDFARGYDLLAAYRLATGIGTPGCLIAAMAICRSIPLYTFNLKHFRQIAGLEVRQPYPRQ